MLHEYQLVKEKNCQLFRKIDKIQLLLNREIHSLMNNGQTKSITSTISPWLTPLAYKLARWIVLPFYFGKIEITGQENIPKTGAVIVTPTHRSRWDAIIVPYSTGKGVSGRHPWFMVTSSEMKGIQGWLIRHLGGFPVDVEHPHINSLQYSVKLLTKGEMVVIFPEGDIYRDRQVHPLKRGVARIALEVANQPENTPIKILPMVIHYTQAFPTQGCHLQVKIGQPLDVTKYLNSSPRKASKSLTQDLEAFLKMLLENNHKI